MTRRDRTITSLLVLALLVFGMASLVPPVVDVSNVTPSASAPGSGRSPDQSAGPSESLDPAAVYREGVLGHPASITPLTARTQADRDIVALVFRGLVRLGPDGTLLPDLASSWTVDGARKHYTFTIRADAVWQDGQPVTATDVAFTVGRLNDPAYAGPLAGSWSEVTAVVVDRLTVRLDLATPLGGFLQAATLPLLPEHLLGRLPVARLADSSFSRQPVGNGPYRLVSLDDAHAVLDAVPAVVSSSFRPSPSPSPSSSPAEPLPQAMPDLLRAAMDVVEGNLAARAGSR